MQTALVTGATGFIGKRLCKQLVDSGWAVRATARETSKTSDLEELGARIVRCDLSQEGLAGNALDGVQTVFHLAGMTTSSNLARLRAVNTDGTRRLAQSILDSGHRPTVVHVSSIAASGPATGGRIRTADDPPSPVSNYGRSKLEGEKEIAKIAGDLPVSIVRPSVVFGPGDREGFRIVEPIAKFGLHITPGWRTPALSVIYVNDLADILMRVATQGSRITTKVAEQPVGEGIYIAAVERHPTYRQWGQMIGEALGRRVRVMPVPPPAARVVGWCAEKMGSGALHADKIREALVEAWSYYDQRLTDQLSMRFSESLPEQLGQTMNWYRDEGWLKKAA